MEGVVTDDKERDAVKALVADELRVYDDMRIIEMQEEHKRQGIKPFHYVPKLIDVNDSNSKTDERYKQIFCITGITNNTASTYGREIAIAGRFLVEQPDIDWKRTPFFLVIGKRSHRAVCLGEWVFSCTAMFRVPGTVFFYLSLDGKTPISQILEFDYRLTPTNQELFSTVVGFRQQLFLAHMLYSQTKTLIDQPMPTSCIPCSRKDGLLLECISCLCKCTKSAGFIRAIQNHGFPLVKGESLYLRYLLEQKLREWISERLEEGCTTGTRNSQGLGVIHMLAILGYRWLIRLYCELGGRKLSLDFTDVSGWTALHWAAFFNRNRTAQLLIDMGANPTIVSRQSIEYPNGLTVAEVASRNGHHKLAIHLANISKTYLQRSNAAAQDAASSQVQVDAESRAEMGGNCESRMKRFQDFSVCGQAVKIQAAFRGFSVRKHGCQLIGEQGEASPRIRNMKSEL